ncbi:MAG: DUF1614 domain-containing protein [Thermoanaerobacterales bacterium]|jgi:hypothetical protein|nr:DUF1614 domain-containing protein [Thermoanaerobacterales bacterium]
MPLGLILLIVISILIYFGFLHRVLDRMHMSDKFALFFIGAMILGTFLPNIPLGQRLAVNLGGGIVPVTITVYLIIASDSAEEKTRAIFASAIAGLAVYSLSRVLPAEPGTMIIDPILIFSIIAGGIAYIFGRSRRNAFIAGVLGVIISDIIYAIGFTTRPAMTVIGGAGILDTAVLAGVIGVGLCELVGETSERLHGGSRAKKEKQSAPEMTSMLSQKKTEKAPVKRDDEVEED